MNEMLTNIARVNRRAFFGKSAMGIGSTALASLLSQDASMRKLIGAESGPAPASTNEKAAGQPGLPGLPHFAPKAKRVVFLWQGGGPSHVDLFDHKPMLKQHEKKDIPDSVRGDTRVSTMTAGQKRWTALGAIEPFKKYGKCGMELSTLLPHTGSIADDICLVRSLHSESVNHAPGVTFFLTGSQVPGRPSMGAWLSYGLGCETNNLPAFVVMTSSDKGKTCGQLFFDYYWGSGFIPSKYQGVLFRSVGDPVPYLANPAGMSRESRRDLLDDISALNNAHLKEYGDPEIDTRIAQYEMAFRMQSSVPDLVDFSKETKETLDMYGPDVLERGTYANQCLMARRLLERGTRFVQVMHSGWDQHRNLFTQLEVQCKDTDQPSAALVKDLKRLGLLDDTLVIFAGEFGRTPFGQGGDPEKPDGRDHFGLAFSWWMAGGGVKRGEVVGKTDDWGWNILEDKMHVHDMQATIMHLCGINHEKFTYKYQGRPFRLTDVHGTVQKKIIA